MRRYTVIIGIAVILTLAIALPVSAQGNAANGESIYMTNCAPCHGQDGKGTLPGQPDFTDPAVWEEISRDQHVSSVKSGVEGTQMPAFQGQLSEQGIQDVVAYERSLAEEGPSGGGGAGDGGAEEGGEVEETPVTGMATKAPEPAVTPVNNELPGFTVLPALTALAIAFVAVLLVRRRR